MEKLISRRQLQVYNLYTKTDVHDNIEILDILRKDIGEFRRRLKPILPGYKK